MHHTGTFMNLPHLVLKASCLHVHVHVHVHVAYRMWHVVWFNVIGMPEHEQASSLGSVLGIPYYIISRGPIFTERRSLKNLQLNFQEFVLCTYMF